MKTLRPAKTTIERNLKTIGEKTGVDISKITKEVDDLKTTILPSVKGMVHLFDNLKEQQERTKENGEDMIV